MFLDWNTSGRDCYVIDIEADSLTPTVIWCLCWRNVKTGETGEARNIEDIRKFFTDTAGSIYVGHNILKYDAPVLGHLAGVKLGVGSLIDTLVLSTLYSPSLSGGHSLEAWGQTLGREKIEFDDWSHLSEEMVTYCHRDVEITCELFQKLIKVLKKIGFSEQSIWLQHRLTVIIDRQQRNGFYFDGPSAIDLYKKLRSREEELQNEIRRVFPPERVLVADRPMFTKSGVDTAIYSKDRERYILREDRDTGRYQAFEDVEFNIGSPKQRIDKLVELGWEPLEFTEKGSPKPFDKGKLSPSLEAFLETRPTPEIELIAKWMSINGRANMINTWLENWDENDGCIHGSLFVANTLRFRHQKPNTANIPAVRVSKDTGLPVLGEEGYYTYEARDLWTARPDRVLVGTDAAGLELRMLAHYLNRRAFTEQVVEGDPHQYNADLVGITRPQAKTLIYACVPMDTKALTRQGWKTYNDLVEGELVLTYNRSTKVKEWKPILEKVMYPSAPVIEAGLTNSFKVRSTPNHRWFTSRRTGRSHNRYRIDEVRTTETLNQECSIYTNAPMVETNSDSGFDWMSLPKYDTDWVDVVLNMTQQERRAFLAGFCIADGHTNKNGSWQWSQLKGPLFEGALLASYLVHDGTLYSSTKTLENGNKIASVILNRKSYVTCQEFSYKFLDDQPVWCIRTENESWVMRQGDTITITGNTLYGASGGKIARTLGVSAKEGGDIRTMFLERLGLKELIEGCQKEQASGRIELIDGSQVICPSPHAALNYKLQGGGARVMGLGAVILERGIQSRRLDALKVGDIHDEWQYDCHPDDAGEHARLSIEAIREAGVRLKMSVPLDGEAKQGRTWAETH